MTGRLYDTARWKRERAAYLRAHPLCVMCEQQGRTSLATVVDHIIPHKGDPVLFWDSVDGRPLDPNHPWNQEG